MRPNSIIAQWKKLCIPIRLMSLPTCHNSLLIRILETETTLPSHLLVMSCKLFCWLPHISGPLSKTDEWTPETC